MAGQNQLQTILKTLEIEDKTDKSEKASNLAGVIPAEVAHASQFKSYVCYGILPADVESKYAGQEFDLVALEAEFVKHCKDYNNPISAEPSKAVEFAAKILFEVDPQIRTEKKAKGYKVVKFVLPYVKSSGQSGSTIKTLSAHSIYVSTFKDSTFLGNHTTNSMIMTFKQAGIIATIIMNKVAKYMYNHNTKTIFTPLASAIFSKDDIGNMASDLGMEAVRVITMINASCCSGGQHIDDSKIECAIAATISATKRMTDKNIRDSIMSNMIKQYTRKQKVYDDKVFEIICQYALGGVPSGLDSKTLITTYESIQVKTANARALAKSKNEQQLGTKPDNIMKPDETIKPSTPDPLGEEATYDDGTDGSRPGGSGNQLSSVAGSIDLTSQVRGRDPK